MLIRRAIHNKRTFIIWQKHKSSAVLSTNACYPILYGSTRVTLYALICEIQRDYLKYEYLSPFKFSLLSQNSNWNPCLSSPSFSDDLFFSVFLVSSIFLLQENVPRLKRLISRFPIFWLTFVCRENKPTVVLQLQASNSDWVSVVFRVQINLVNKVVTLHLRN